jgi:drug/metabolite transporter (DMT)-like permease
MKARQVQALEIKTYILRFPIVLFGSAGNTILDKGMRDIGALNLSTPLAMGNSFLITFSSSTIWLGVACMLLFMLCHMLVLSWADYSFVMPFTAVAYALVPLLAHEWLGEAVPAVRWAGIVLIVLGVFLVSRTPPRTTQPAPDAHGAGSN